MRGGVVVGLVRVQAFYGHVPKSGDSVSPSFSRWAVCHAGVWLPIAGVFLRADDVLPMLILFSFYEASGFGLPIATSL